MKNGMFVFPDVVLSQNRAAVHFEGPLETVLGLSSPASPAQVYERAYEKILLALQDRQDVAIEHFGDDPKKYAFYHLTYEELMRTNECARWCFHALCVVSEEATEKFYQKYFKA